jgi:general secretion pathway protein A
MDYFRILNLNGEPFSNSPEPGFFYQSSQHLGCLQKLELAIRLRRGLNVVMGDVGAGKTTICRELIIRLTKSEEDRNTVEAHLLLDPSTNTPLEFLGVVATAFGLTDTPSGSEWPLKEAIKNYLHQKGVIEEKIVILLIDEGQKLPAFALEILREFLNYETNEAKLLQIVIFAQNEFRDVLLSCKNLADRVNQFIYIGPLNFSETARMIEYRVARAGGGRNARLFTWPGLLAVYRASKGYPRRIIAVCHQSILAMIIQNRKKAGWFTVRSCASRVAVEAETKKVPLPVKILIVLFLIVAATMIWTWPLLQSSFRPAPASVAVSIHEPGVIAKESESALTTVKKEAASAGQKQYFEKPATLGSVRIKKGQNIYTLLQRVYGAYSDEQFQAFLQANPQIKNINLVVRGEKISFPAIPAPGKPLSEGKSRVALLSKKSLEEAMDAFFDWPNAKKKLRLIPYWNLREGLVFALFVIEEFPGEKEADEYIKSGPSENTLHARIVSSFPAGTEFYAR